MRKLFFTVILILCYVANGKCQTLSVVSLIDTQYQECLDKGESMMDCTALFYNQMDSLLNSVYTQLRKNKRQQEKDALKADELTWLKKRDKYFKQQEKDLQKEYGGKNQWGTDIYMFLHHAEARFIEARVVTLIERLNKVNK